MSSLPFITVLKKNQREFHPIVSFDGTKDKLLPFNLTSGNTELSDTILNDTGKFTTWVNEKLKNANARYGIGGYAEYRTVYSRSKIFDAHQPGEEPRRLHLGVDIWGKPHTAVMAPVQSFVHSFAFNDRHGDYGTTIILRHQLEKIIFYTLYGHLSLSSIKNMQEGDSIAKGDVFAEFGIPSENGHWPPHLHFQVISDTGNWKGDYPGVCKFSEKEKYLENCPDPDLILQLNQYL